MTANGGVAPQPNILGWVAFFAPLGLTLFLSFRLQKMSFGAVQGFLGHHGADGRAAGHDPVDLYRRQRGHDLLRHRRPCSAA